MFALVCVDVISVKMGGSERAKKRRTKLFGRTFRSLAITLETRESARLFDKPSRNRQGSNDDEMAEFERGSVSNLNLKNGRRSFCRIEKANITKITEELKARSARTAESR